MNPFGKQFILESKLRNYLCPEWLWSRQGTHAEWRYLLLFLSLVLLPGCDFYKKSSPSIVLIAIDSLKYDDVNCADENLEVAGSGFGYLCNDSIRFSHAITTSTLAAPSLGSILTARYPYEHGLWHNGRQFLSARVETIAERVVKKGVRTGFFSGGPPIWRKSGLSQGFERFDDYISLGVNRLYRNADTSFGQFLSWLDGDVGSAPFFGVIFLPDLQFSRVSTYDEQGQLRERSIKGQLDSIDRAIGRLRAELLERGRWHNTHVIVSGLNGRADNRRNNELSPYSLYSENIRVPLFIKPETKRMDRSVQWNVDANVNHVDVGEYISEVFGASEVVDRQRLAKPISIRRQIESKRSSWPSKRMLLVESGWPYWRMNSSARFGVVKDEKLLLYQNPIKAYNIWSDRFQVSSIKDSEQFEDIGVELEAFLSQRGFGYFNYPSKNVVNKHLIANDLWGFERPSDEALLELESYVRGNDGDWESNQWRAYWAIKLSNWKRLARIGKELDSQIYTYIANVNLKKPSEVPSDPCFELLEKEMSSLEVLNEFRSCDDDLYRSFLAWVKDSKSIDKSKYGARFLKQWKRHIVERRVLELNWANGLVWDTSIDKYLGPTLVELVWSLPKYHRFRKRTKRAVGVTF